MWLHNPRMWQAACLTTRPAAPWGGWRSGQFGSWRGHRVRRGEGRGGGAVKPLATTLIGSYPQPDWLIDRERLRSSLPARVRAAELWRVPAPYLQQAQDDATALAIRDFERAGIDIVTDGEIRRESYSNRFATALEGMDIEQPGDVPGRAGGVNAVPRVVGPVRRTRPVEVAEPGSCARTPTARSRSRSRARSR